MKSIINNQKSFYLLCLALLVSMIGWSQTYSEDDYNSNTQATTELNGTQVSQADFNSFFNTTPNEALDTVEGNSVFISQVSSFNNAVVKVASNASEINIYQNGDNNEIGLTYKVDVAVAELEQNGNNNTIFDYVINPSEKISLDLEQNGSNLTFDKFGSNSITKNIKFNQTEASPTIIIRSFN